MSYGGPTWDTAGELTYGATNTFDLADVTETGVGTPYMHAWWTYTPAADRVILLDTGDTTGALFSPDTMINVYTGPDEASKALVVSNDDTEESRLAAVAFPVTGGVTYHVLVGVYGSSDGIETYRLKLSPTNLRSAATDWLDTFRDRDDNVLIVGSPALTPENPWPAWQTPQFWYDDLRLGPIDQRAPGRRAGYQIQSVFGGADLLDGADDCAWGHAIYGDNNGSTLWNTSRTDPSDNGPPTCAPLGEGAVDITGDTALYSLDYGAPGAFTAGSMIATVRIAAFSPALRYARDNMPPQGALSFFLADALADGVPAEYADDATFEWDPEGELELLSVEITGDDNGGFDLPETTFLINPDVGPTYVGGGTFTDWTKGVPAATTGFTYTDGPADWHPVPDITSFDDLADDGPDMVVASVMSAALDTAAPAFVQEGNSSSVGFRFTFRSPRYRWTWIEEATTRRMPPRRGIPRHQLTTAPRGAGGRDSVQDGPRGVGGVV